MMNEEEYIRQKMGKENPFTVPEGYFGQLSDNIISKLPANDEASIVKMQRPAIVRYIRPLLYAAACIVFAVVATTIYNYASSDSTQLMAQQDTSVSADSYIEDMADYAMLDNEDIYASLLADI